MDCKNSKGQGATEYMVLLGAVLVIAIGVVTLLSLSSNVSGEASITEAQIYWRSIKPLAVLDAKNLNGACSGAVGGRASGYRLVVTNSDPDPVYITGVGIDGVSKTFCTEGATSASSRIEVGTGKTVKIDVQGSSCTLDATTDFSLAFTYDTPYLDGKREAGTKKLAFKCAEPTVVSLPVGTCGNPCSACVSMETCEEVGCTWSGTCS